MASRARKTAPRGRSLSTTAESLGMRMKSYYDSGHLCRISYHPRARIAHALADGWSSSSRPRPSELSPLFVDGDIDVGTIGHWMDKGWTTSQYRPSPKAP